MTPEQSTFTRIFETRNIYFNTEAKTEFWHWSETSEGLQCAHLADSVNILVKYDPNEDDDFGT